MPELNWVGKEAVKNHDKEVPFKLLRKVPSASMGDKSENLIIHGDNLEALKALMPFYKSKIKCIYIDPPYNTGNEGWKYNDKVNSPKIKKWLGKVVGGESEDLNRHDKWLCMMYPRLKLLRDLLAESGIIFISIDDNEFNNLSLLMREIFGGKNYVETFIWKSRLGKGATAKKTAKLHEYILCYAKNFDKVSVKTDQRFTSKTTKERLRQWGQGDRREDRPTMYYGIESEEFGAVFPVKPDKTDGRWRVSKQSMDRLIADGMVFFEKQKDGRVEAYRVIPEGNETNTAYSSILDPEKVKTTAHGSIELKSLFNEQTFDYPKPSSLIKELISISTKDSEETLILDSFAGSGTTGQAVMDLNKNGGNYKFVLVEMEDNVAKDITAGRIKRAIEKYNYKDGFEYCELDKPLFDEKGQIDESCTFEQLATYIYFTETHTNIDKNAIKENFIGELGDTEYYLLFNGRGKNGLDETFLKSLIKNSMKKIIYADRCLIDEETLAEYNIVFKQIPYEIERY